MGVSFPLVNTEWGTLLFIVEKEDPPYVKVKADTGLIARLYMQ